MPRPKIGLALGSGGARGWAHIGVIEALLERKIVPDVVGGTSIGSLVGAAYATDRLTQLRTRMEALDWREIASYLDVRFYEGGLIAGERIEAMLRELGISTAIEACGKRYGAVATDLSTGREVWLQTGPIDKAVRASIGMPGVFSPFRLDDAWLVDGGLVNPVPVSLCRALGADIIIAVDLNGGVLDRHLGSTTSASVAMRREFVDHIVEGLPAGFRDPLKSIAADLLAPAPSVPGYFDVFTNCLNIMQDHIMRTRLAGEPPHVLFRPKLSDMKWMEFHRVHDTIAEGRACVERNSEYLHAYFPDLVPES